MIPNDVADDEVKGEADEEENEDALCVLRRCCLELLSALAAVTAACSCHRQGGRQKKETPGGRCRRRIIEHQTNIRTVA